MSRKFSVKNLIVIWVMGLLFLPLFGAFGAQGKDKKIVLIAGVKSHKPGEHEYEKTMMLFMHCLDTAPNVKKVSTEVYVNGWPQDEKVLDDADTIVLFCDGASKGL